MYDADRDAIAQHIVSLERAALERWRCGDPSGFLEISAPDVVYFDPTLPARMDGLEALSAYYEALRGKVSFERYDLANAKVHVIGTDAAVLTFNFASYGGDEGASHWNCTEVYRRDAEGWRIIQTHWSLAPTP